MGFGNAIRDFPLPNATTRIPAKQVVEQPNQEDELMKDFSAGLGPGMPFSCAQACRPEPAFY